MASGAGGGLPPLPKSLSGLLSFSRESFSRAEATIGGILGSGSNPAHPTTPAGGSRGGSSSSSSGYISSSSTASPSVVSKENVAPTPTLLQPHQQHQQQQPRLHPQHPHHQHLQQQQHQPATGFQQYSSVKSDPRPNPSPSPFRPIQSPGPRAFQVSLMQDSVTSGKWQIYFGQHTAD